MSVACLVLAAVAATPAAPSTSQRVALDLGLSASAPAGAVGVSYGRDVWFVRAEISPWLSLSMRPPLQPGVLNLTVGRQWLWAEGRVRSALALGTSTLFFDTVLHERGRTGLSLQIVPLSWRMKWGKQTTLRLEPMTLHVPMPVLGGIPLVLPQYRHSAGLEWAL